MTRRSGRAAPSPAPAAARHGAGRRPSAPPEVPEALARRLGLLGWAVLAVLGAALLAVALGPHRIGDYFTETDFYGAYAEGARLVQQGRLEPARYGVVGPGYEVALAIAGLVVRDLFLAAELLSVVSALVIAGVWHALLRRLADARLAFLALLFIASNPILFRYGFSATTDAFAVALQAAALGLLLAGRSPRAAFAAGAVAALAFLTRYSAAFLLPAGLIVALAGGGIGAARRGCAAALFAAGFALPVVPWVLYSLTHGGGFSFQLHHNIAYEVFARSRGIVWDEYQKHMQPQFRTLWDVIARDPGAVAARMLFNVGDHLRLDARDLLGWPIGACAALGLVMAAWDGTLRRLWAVVAAGVLGFLLLVPAFHSARYSLALLPVYAALAAVPFATARLGLRLGPVRAASLAALLPLAFAVRGIGVSTAHVLDQLPREVLPVSATLRAQARPGDRVIARKPHLAWQAGLTALPFPFADTLDSLAAYARAQRARWLFVSWVEVETRPRFWFLLDTAAVVPGLTVRHATRSHPAVLYEIGPEFGRRPAWLGNDTLMTWHAARARLMVDASNAESWYLLGLAEAFLGPVDSARVHLERSLAGDGAHRMQALLLLGQLALQRGDPAEAERTYGRAAALRPNDIDAQVGLGWASLLAGDPARAAERWRPVVAFTRDPATLDRRAELFAALGDRAAAAEACAARARAEGGTP
jgi:tetratricopeptide (TPR) repeat protein